MFVRFYCDFDKYYDQNLSKFNNYIDCAVGFNITLIVR